MESITDPLEFAQQIFGKAHLGDARRTHRLVDAAAALATHPGSSIPAACENDGARVQGFYKLVRNDDVDPAEIRRSVFNYRRVTVKDESSYLWEAAQNAPIFGTRQVTVEQRGGKKKGLEQSACEARPRRQITTTLRATRVEINKPGGKKTLCLNLVYVFSDDGGLEWLLHMQILANLPDDSVPATEVLSQPELEVLWAKVERRPLPEKVPSCRWAYTAIAKIAGWQDSKRTGRIDLDTLWRGIDRMLGLAEGWQMAKALNK